MGRALLLHSGGIDSTILGNELKKQNIDFISLFFLERNQDYGEARAVRRTSALLESDLHVIDISSTLEAFVPSKYSIVRPAPNPGKHVIELGTILLYAPALTYAHSKGIDKIYVGFTKVDADASLEYGKQFLNAFSSLAEKAGFGHIAIEAPFIEKTKAEVLKLGEDIPELLTESWSCIQFGYTQCGCCTSCKSRKQAFTIASMTDYTNYE